MHESQKKLEKLAAETLNFSGLKMPGMHEFY